MLGLFLLGYISRKAGNPEAVTGVIAGVLLITWMSLSPVVFSEGFLFSSPFHTNLTIVFGTMTIFFVGLMMTKFLINKKQPPSCLPPRGKV
jgi:SSS family solute:Na+ symporter